MANPIRVALVNDYVIVLEGLRVLLEASSPDIEVSELDIKKGPTRTGGRDAPRHLRTI